jgi:hypothetical protein
MKGTYARRIRLVETCVAIAAAIVFAAPSRGATPVTVDNSTAVAVAVAKALQVGEPFEATLACTILFTNVCQGTYTVSSSQRLVIEYVSLICPSSILTPTFGLFIIHSTGAGVTGDNAVSLPENAGGGFAQLGQPVKIYVDAKSQIVITVALRTGAFASSPPSQIPLSGIPCSVTLNGRQIAD